MNSASETILDLELEQWPIQRKISSNACRLDWNNWASSKVIDVVRKNLNGSYQYSENILYEVVFFFMYSPTGSKRIPSFNARLLTEERKKERKEWIFSAKEKPGVHEGAPVASFRRFFTCIRINSVKRANWVDNKMPATPTCILYYDPHEIIRKVVQ